MGTYPIGALYRRYQPKLCFQSVPKQFLDCHDVCRIVETFSRTSRLGANLTGLQRQYGEAASFEYSHLVTLEIYVLVSTVCSMRGSQNADQKLVESFGLLGLRTPPRGLNLQCHEQSQPITTSHFRRRMTATYKLLPYLLSRSPRSPKG
jgi:hypothetical protein